MTSPEYKASPASSSSAASPDTPEPNATTRLAAPGSESEKLCQIATDNGIPVRVNSIDNRWLDTLTCVKRSVWLL
ncbi:hypothetical protein ACFX13_041694 [Malus domestica]